MKKETAQRLIFQNIQTYNRIARHFDRKRSFITKDLIDLAQYIKPKDRVLDVGCGNGRFYELVCKKKAKYWGIDTSEKMIELAKRKYPRAKFFVSEPFSFPFGKNFFDKIYCLSVIHHIPSKEFRIRLLKEIKRVMKPGSLLILTAWNLRKKKKIKPLLLKYTLKKLFGKSDLDFYDIFLPWKDENGGILATRYLHIFSKKELVSLLKEAGFQVETCGVIKRSTKESNIFAVAKKPSFSSKIFNSRP